MDTLYFCAHVNNLLNVVPKFTRQVLWTITWNYVSTCVALCMTIKVSYFNDFNVNKTMTGSLPDLKSVCCTASQSNSKQRLLSANRLRTSLSEISVNGNCWIPQKNVKDLSAWYVHSSKIKETTLWSYCIE